MEFTNLSIVIIDAIGHDLPPLSRIARVPDMQASRELTSLSLGPPELQVNYVLNRNLNGINKSEPGQN